jgi:hypothetical protein
VTESQHSRNAPEFTARGEEKLLGLEPYWWSIVVFASLAIVILVVRYIVYG